MKLETEGRVQPDLAVLGRRAECARLGGGVVDQLLVLLQHPQHAEPLTAVSAKVLVSLVRMLRQEVVPAHKRKSNFSSPSTWKRTQTPMSVKVERYHLRERAG